MFIRIRQKLEILINRVELLEISISYFFVTLFFIITLRNFLEFFSDKKEILLENLFHYYAFYFSLIFSLIILFRFITKDNIVKVFKIITFGTMAIFIAPIVDLFLNKDYNYCYLLPGTHDNLLERFLLFFGNTGECGITIGLRVEIAIILFGCLIYFYVKTKSKIKTIIAIFLSYCLFFIYFTSPFIVAWILSIFDLKYTLVDLPMLQYFLFLIFIQIVILAFTYDKKTFFNLVKDLRYIRIFFFLLLFILGAVIGRLDIEEFSLSQELFFNFILIPISFLYAFIFAIITNNLADYNIDKISNANRPHVNSELKITKQAYEKIAWLSLFLSIIYSAAVGEEVFFLMLLFSGNYFIYSFPPLRLKRITLFSKVFISLNSLIMIMMGYIMLTSSIIIFPFKIAIFIILGFTAAANFIDIKDYEGDKQEGIKTLPVVFGLKNAKLLIGTIFFLINIFACLIFGNIVNLSFLLIFGLVEFLLIIRKKYYEKLVFLVIILSLLLSIISVAAKRNEIFMQEKPFDFSKNISF